MRLAAYEIDGTRYMGVVGTEGVFTIGTLDGFYKDVPAGLEAASNPGGKPLALGVEELHLVPPVPDVARVICVGVNYRRHAEEASAKLPSVPNVFARWASTLVADGEKVPLPPGEPRLDWEGELAAIVGSRLYGASEEAAGAAILGYTCFNDLSTREHQMAASQWTLGKNADGSGPIGPVVVTPDEVGDPYNLQLTTRVNGETMQSASTGDMIFRAPKVLAYVSEVMSLRPGDVLATGTPDGVGFARKPPIFLGSGDRVEVEIEKIGILRNTIA
ncbi:MAG: fumarylacetoacetate hydrolase family protein [Actinobacteria bacterium]|nr:fumarylacetoacetate hydrolase family protein [Actinomycetota bacterium]